MEAVEAKQELIKRALVTFVRGKLWHFSEFVRESIEAQHSHAMSRYYIIATLTKTEGKPNRYTAALQGMDWVERVEVYAETYQETRYYITLTPQAQEQAIREFSGTSEGQGLLAAQLGQREMWAMFRDWIKQRPGIDSYNRNSGDYRRIAKQKDEALQELGLFLDRDWNPVEMGKALRGAFSGRLLLRESREGGVELDYCTGQYWPTEYRAAAAAVLREYNNATEPPYTGEIESMSEWDKLYLADFGRADVFKAIKAPYWVVGRDCSFKDTFAVPAASYREANRIQYWVLRHRDDVSKVSVTREKPRKATSMLAWRYFALSVERESLKHE